MHDSSKQKPLMRVQTLTMLILVTAVLPTPAFAQTDDTNDSFIFGVKIRAGGRFDNVRACAASPAGAKGGMAADISFFTEIGASEKLAIHIDLPVFRPIMFGAAFKMLQFEPSVTLKFRHVSSGKIDFVGGPTIGISLHYGPDFESEVSGDNVGDSFFAMGPFLGGYVGMDFKRPGKTFNFELGLTPYVIPLFGISDPENHKGVVVGGLLDGSFKFNP